MRWIVAPAAPEKSKGILCATRQKMEMHRAAGALKYDHNSFSKAWLPCDDHIAICSVLSAPYSALLNRGLRCSFA
jgi:hypothetical protein